MKFSLTPRLAGDAEPIPNSETPYEFAYAEGFTHTLTITDERNVSSDLGNVDPKTHSIFCNSTLKGNEVTDITVINFLSALPLEIKSCITAIDLSKSNCTAHTIDFLRESLPNLRYLKLDSCPFLQNNLSELEPCKKVTYLSLAGSELPSKQLSRLGSCFPSLETLVLKKNHSLNDEGVTALLSSKSESLQNLDIMECPNVSFVAIKSLAAYLHREGAASRQCFLAFSSSSETKASAPILTQKAILSLFKTNTPISQSAVEQYCGLPFTYRQVFSLMNRHSLLQVHTDTSVLNAAQTQLKICLRDVIPKTVESATARFSLKRPSPSWKEEVTTHVSKCLKSEQETGSTQKICF